MVDGPWKLVGLSTEGDGDLRPQPALLRPGQATPGQVRRASVHERRSGVLGAARGSGTEALARPARAIRFRLATCRTTTSHSPGRSGPRAISSWTGTPSSSTTSSRTSTTRPVGPILRQLYFRQAFQHLVDQQGWIHAYYGGLGVPTYGPVPASPLNPYADANASVNPYPFSISAARTLLAGHGWKVVPNGVTTCARPGPGPDDCGKGIPQARGSTSPFMYPSGLFTPMARWWTCSRWPSRWASRSPSKR